MATSWKSWKTIYCFHGSPDEPDQLYTSPKTGKNSYMKPTKSNVFGIWDDLGVFFSFWTIGYFLLFRLHKKFPSTPSTSSPSGHRPLVKPSLSPFINQESSHSWSTPLRGKKRMPKTSKNQHREMTYIFNSKQEKKTWDLLSTVGRIQDHTERIRCFWWKSDSGGFFLEAGIRGVIFTTDFHPKNQKHGTSAPDFHPQGIRSNRKCVLYSFWILLDQNKDLPSSISV